MSESIDKRTLPPDNPEAEKQREQKESERYLQLARESPHSLTEEIKRNPKTEPLLRKILGDAEYDRIKDLNPVKLSEESGVAKMQKEIYSFVDIHPDTDRNATKEKFIKGIIDSIIIENSELAMKIIETKGAILKDMLAQIFSWEGLKQIAEGLKTSVLHLFSGDAYKTGKSLGELGLIAIGSGAGGFILKRVGKGAIKAGERVAVNAGKETIVSGGLQMGGRVTEGAGRVIQAPYNAIESGVKKVGGVIKDGVKTGSEAIGNIPQVQKVIEPARKIVSEGMDRLSDGTRRIVTATKERAKEVLALASVPILVGSKDGIETSSRLKGQIGAIGDDVGKIKPFEKGEGKPVNLKAEKKELGFDISKNEIYSQWQYAHLKEYAEFLGELKEGDILGHGVNAMVVRHPTREGYVVKIPKRGGDDIVKETMSHNKAYIALRQGKREGIILNTIEIPEIQIGTENQKNYFIIKKIDGQSLHTKFLREHPDLQIVFKDIPKEKLDKMTDEQVWRTAMHYGKGSEFWVDKMYNLIDFESGAFTKEFLQKNYPEYQKMLQYFKDKGIEHNDLHGGNFMIGNDGKLYLIDFGKASLK